MASPDIATIVLSAAGAAVVASLPKLIDIVFGARLARRKDTDEREAAYRMSVFDDAAQARKDRAEEAVALRLRIAHLEAELERRRLEDTGAYVLRKRATKDGNGGASSEGRIVSGSSHGDRGGPDQERP